MYNHNDTNDNRTCCTYSSSTQTNVLCNGGTTGTMTASASGGTTAYTYVIAGQVVNTTGATSGVFTGLKAGSYTITVTDAKGCTTTTTQSITEPVALTATITYTILLFNGVIKLSKTAMVSFCNTEFTYVI